MRIDTHAHAFPALETLTERFPERIRSGAEHAVGALARLFGDSAQKRARGPLLDVEAVARLRKGRSRIVNHAADLAMGVVMLPQVACRGTLVDLVGSMERHQIDQTVVIAGRGVAPNEWLLEQAAMLDGRIIAVAHPPELPSDAPLDEWLTGYDALANAGARGFKIHPNMDGFEIGSPPHRALFETARNHGCFVIIHTGCFNVVGYKHQRPSTPDLFDGFFSDYPDVRTCLAHMNRDSPEVAWDIMKRHTHLVTDVSWQPAEAIARAIQLVGDERIVFGSDWPLLHADLQGDSAAQVERATSSAQYEMITETAAAQLVGS